MRLTWRDGAATVLAGFVVAVMLALTLGWSWPLLGDFRAGVVALAIIGFGMCSLGMRATRAAEFAQPHMVLASLLGVLAAALIVLGVVFATETLFLILGFTLLALWVLTTVDHALPAAGARSLGAGR